MTSQRAGIDRNNRQPDGNRIDDTLWSSSGTFRMWPWSLGVKTDDGLVPLPLPF